MTFELPVTLLACLGVDGALAVHPGEVTLRAGGASDGLPVSGVFRIVGEWRLLADRQAFLSTVRTP